MGASSSVLLKDQKNFEDENQKNIEDENQKNIGDVKEISENIYKKLSCGCIYRYNSKLELPYCCYDCLIILQNGDSIKNNIFYETENNKSKEKLLNLNSGWKNEKEAIDYANENNIIIFEFIKNKDVLERFSIGTHIL
jgi:hypothetical protein